MIKMVLFLWEIPMHTVKTFTQKSGKTALAGESAPD
jgi:hypothetical protein